MNGLYTHRINGNVWITTKNYESFFINIKILASIIPNKILLVQQKNNIIVRNLKYYEQQILI
jgi:hypothetical protein